ncbi:MAG TPA: endonuclease/exonuclease/phosphatase family protein [Hyphomicrobiales bacterium]|nr:endonuclease/exonuclease/phosphatase family protein [Rhodobiaceae bacterium]HXK54394.1 endonuclease/exonuclease/phosphatase family protein [Hyphomicrobiales bacterium]
MRLATFNLESLGSNAAGSAPLDERIAALKPQLERLDADILCLQEVNGQRPDNARPRDLIALRRLLDATIYRGHHMISTHGARKDAVSDLHNLVILSRYPITASEELRHRLVDPPLYRARTAEPAEETPQPVQWDRPLLHATLELPGGRVLHVVNLHLRAPLAAPVAGQKSGPFAWHSVEGWAEGFFIAAMKRLGQAVEVRRLADALFNQDPDALIAVTGDFNAEDRASALRIAVGSQDDTGNGALAGAMLIPVDRNLAADRRYSVTHHGRPQMLDHILVSRSLLAALRSVDVHNEVLFDELIGPARIDAPPGSFHAPLVAEFAL